ncbi:MAG: DUF6298 domain-containing protein [Cyclobacteriaceae bacterium]
MNQSPFERRGWFSIFFLLFTTFFIYNQSISQDRPPIYLQNGQLQYSSSENGDRVPDFSYAGYQASNTSIPTIPAAVFVSWKSGDQTVRIQKAIDHVSGLPVQANGFRGAVLLDKGEFELAEGLKICASGVVLRGNGVGETTLLGTGLDRTTVIRIFGEDDRVVGNEVQIADSYVPVGASLFTVKGASNLKTGDEIQITRKSTKEWISNLGMENFGGETGYIGWREGERDITWNRTITQVSGNKVSIDAPLTASLDKEIGPGVVAQVKWSGRIQNVGIENIKLASTYDKSNPKDEQHRWMAITLESVRDAWVRQVDFEHFAGSAVAIWNSASRITVEDCRSFDPVSEIGGQRRYTFFTEGQQCLFQRIYAEFGYHDFAVGFMAAGPNAFVECRSVQPESFSGAIDSWASGVLFDIVNVDAQALRFGNRGMEAQGAGWTAANSMFWQCSASLIECSAPPTSMNWAFAAWSQFSGNGYWHEPNSFLKPRSLFYGQLQDRLEGEVQLESWILPITNEASSSPTLEQAETFIKEAYHPAPSLQEWIAKARERNPISTNQAQAKLVDEIKVKNEKKGAQGVKVLSLKEGKLLIGNSLAIGSRQTVQWWRGNVRLYDAMKARPHVSRYVPGRVGTGHTDDLHEATNILKSNNVTVLDHNYGLWYDRRRDDHERVRRMNGEVWAPFYELPFARSGQGIAYDGLSKYDLTQFNFWYWNRLSSFVDLAEQKGLVLYHQNYFQHNILEAGGHYADFPWRTANNINNMPFPEPVNYAGDKRIFMAEQFYDVSDPEYRKLHKGYIRKCLSNFAKQSNVIQFISAEYTGPLSFMNFWLDVVKEWEKETGNDVLIALSATKDVQDAIMNDPIRSKIVDVIDIRYWWYGENKQGETEAYAPQGGKNLAPRQHARLVKTPKETFESIYMAVKEYADEYPEKAIIYNTHRSSAFGWAIFMAGGSLMNIPQVSDSKFLEAASRMKPLTTSGANPKVLLNKKTGERIYYLNSINAAEFDMSDLKGIYTAYSVNTETGKVTEVKDLEGGQKHKLQGISTNVIWLSKR